MPQANNSWWINAYSIPEDRYEDYLIKDVTEYIEDKYNVDTENQYIAGFSMGGYGALVLSLRHPDRFSFAASIAGAIMYPRDTEILDTIPRYEFAVPSTDQAFGKIPNRYRDEFDPFRLYKYLSLEDFPYIFLFSGLQDYFSAIPVAQRELADSLKTYGAFYEYHELQGGHNSKTVDASLSILLPRIEYLRSRYYKSISSVLWHRYLKSGIDSTIQVYHELKAKNANEYNFSEAELNILGYQLLSMEKVNEAIEIFKLNIEQYPESSNVYDSLGETLEKNNKLEQAAENYKKAYNIGIEQSSNSLNVYKRNLDRVLNMLQGK